MLVVDLPQYLGWTLSTLISSFADAVVAACFGDYGGSSPKWACFAGVADGSVDFGAAGVAWSLCWESL